VKGTPAHPRSRRQALLIGTLIALALVAAGCGALGYTSATADRQNGKKLFVEGAKGKASCGSCHTLADAGTTGTIGPNLDLAFREALRTGMTEDTVRQVVRGQIAYAIDDTTTGAPGMPKDLVTGDDAKDVAAYVASAVAKSAASAETAAPATTTPATTTPAPAPGSSSGGSQSGSGTSGGGGSGQAAAGKQVFLGAGGCGACHTLADAGSTGTVGPDLDKVAADAKKAGKEVPDYVETSIVDPNAYVAPGFPKGVMPPDFGKTLTSKQIADLVAYIVSAAGA
jgi:mono/diheme cytochrome c family protein